MPNDLIPTELAQAHWTAFALALAIGALIGVEREKHRRESGRSSAGLRTFMLLALTGALLAWLGQQTGQAWLFAVGLLGAAVLMSVGSLRAPPPDHADLPASDGITTRIAALLTFLLGGLCVYGPTDLAVALAIACSAILAFREPLHGLVARIDTPDLYAALKLLIASFIVLPLLPNHAIDPYNILNPFKVWLLVVLISGLSLVGYVLTRMLGQTRGTAVTALAGALVSSTAVTLELARRARETPALHRVVVGGVALAWGVMYLRILAILAVAHPESARALLGAGGSLAALCLLAGVVAPRQNGAAAPAPLHLQNPFSLIAASKFAAVFVAILALVRLSQHYFPGESLYAVAMLAGSVDVDAITLSLSQMQGNGTSGTILLRAILLATLANTLVKTGMALFVGGRPLWRPMAALGGVISVLTVAWVWWI